MRCFYVLKKWSSAKLSLNRDLSLNKMSLNRDCTVLLNVNKWSGQKTGRAAEEEKKVKVKKYDPMSNKRVGYNKRVG